MKQQTWTATLVIETCCSCGVAFGMPQVFVTKRLEDGAWFYCPNGHAQHYTEPTIDKLKKEIAAAERKANLYQGYYQAEQSDHQHTRNRLTATKGVVTKTKKRIAEGTCPCCDKHFTMLAKHMASAHPEYQNEDGDDTATGEPTKGGDE